MELNNKNCCGIKILDLESKRELTGNEYLAIAEKDNNYKTPVDLLVNLVVANPSITSLIQLTISELMNLFSGLNSKVELLTQLLNLLQTNYLDVLSKYNQLELKVTLITNNYESLNSKLGNINDLIDDDSIIEIVNNAITENKVKILDPVLTAINKGQGINQPMPSDNNYKILLDTWTGTAEEYLALQGIVDGMTYNIIEDEE